MYSTMVFNVLNAICTINNEAFDENSPRFNPKWQFALDCEHNDDNSIELLINPSVLLDCDSKMDCWYGITFRFEHDSSTVLSELVFDLVDTLICGGGQGAEDFAHALMKNGCEESVAWEAALQVNLAAKYVEGCIDALLLQN